MWEYKSTAQLNEKQLNELGAQGWELVAVGVGGMGALSFTMFFKRPKK